MKKMPTFYNGKYATMIITDRNGNVVECDTMPCDNVCRKCGYDQKCLNWLVYYYKKHSQEPQPLSPELAEKINEIKAAISGVNHDRKQNSAEIKEILFSLSNRVAELENIIFQFQSIFTKPIDLSWALQMFMAMMDKQGIVLESANPPDFKNTPDSLQEKFDNTMIFIDGQNLRGAFYEDYQDYKHRVSPEDAVCVIEKELQELMPDAKIRQIHYFDGVRCINGEIDERQEKFFQALYHLPLYKIYPIGEYTRKKDGVKSTDVDEPLIDCVLQAISKFKLDTIVLVTGDKHYIELVQQLQKEKITVVIAFPENSPNFNCFLKNQANWTIDLSELGVKPEKAKKLGGK